MYVVWSERRPGLSKNQRLENGRSTPRCLTVQSAIRLSLLRDSSHTDEISTPVACNAACVKEKRFCKRGREMCFSVQPNVGMSVCMCVSSLNKSPVHSYLCVCVCVMKCSWECYKRSAQRCMSVCAHIRSRVGMGVCMGVCMCAYVCVCHHHSPVDKLLVSAWKYMYANTAERLRLHKAVFYC